MADLLIEAGNQRLFIFCLSTRPRREQIGQAVQGLLLPLRNLGRMHSILSSYLVRRFLCLDRFQGDLGLQVCALSLALFWHLIPPSEAPLDTAILS